HQSSEQSSFVFNELETQGCWQVSSSLAGWFVCIVEDVIYDDCTLEGDTYSCVGLGTPAQLQTDDSGSTGDPKQENVPLPAKTPPLALLAAATKAGASAAAAAAGKLGDPVQLSSGELVHSTIDLALPSSEYPIRFERNYRSAGVQSSRLGRNWQHVFEERLEVVDNDFRNNAFPQRCYDWLPWVHCIYHHRGDGGGNLYLLDTSGVGAPNTFISDWSGLGILRARIRRDAGEQQSWAYALRLPTGELSEFDAHGRLRRKLDQQGHELVYEYESEEADAALLRVLDDRGHGFRFEYGLWGLLTAVEDVVLPGASGRRVEFCYDLALLPRYGEFADDLDGLLAYLGLDASERCFRPTAALPSFDELSAIVRFGAVPHAASRIRSYLQRQSVYWEDIPAPLEMAYHYAGSVKQSRLELLRSLAVLREARFVPRPGSGSAQLASRYQYSERPFELDFQLELSQARGNWFRDLVDSLGGTIAACSEASSVRTLRGERELNGLLGKLVRVERLLTPEELGPTGPLSSSSAIRQDGAEYWLTELETRYDWNPRSAGFGRVSAQRHGSSDLSVTTSAPSPGDADWSSLLPQYSFAYGLVNDDDFWSGGAGQLMSATASVLAADGHALATIARRPAGCQDLRWSTSLYASDGCRDSQSCSYADAERLLAHRRAMRSLCEVVRTQERSGTVSYHGLNYLGQVLVELRQNPDSAQGWRARAYRYDDYGQVLEWQDGVESGVADAGSTLLSYASGHRLERGNVLRLERRPGSARGAAELVQGSMAAPLIWQFAYEPLTNQVAWEQSPNGQVHRRYFEYEEGVQAYRRALGSLQWFAPTATVDLTPPMQDLNGDGQRSLGRALVVREEWSSPEGHAQPRWRELVYNTASQLVSTVDESGQRLTLSYSPRYDLSSDQASREALSAGFAPVSRVTVLPERADAEEGGPLLEQQEQSVGSYPSGFSVEGQAQLRYLRSPWDGQLLAIEHQAETQSYSTFSYDGHGRLVASTNPDGLVRSFGYDGANALLWSSSAGGFGLPLYTRQFYSAEGELMARCEGAGVQGGCAQCWSSPCSAPLWELEQRRASGDTSFILRSVERDGENRLLREVSGEGRWVEWSYDAGGALQSRIQPSSDGYVEQRFERDASGLLLFERLQSPSSNEVLARGFGYDGFGRMVGSRDENGGLRRWRYASDGALSEAWTASKQGVFEQGVVAHRDAAGFVSSLEQRWSVASSLQTTTQQIARSQSGRPVCVLHADGRRQLLGWHSDGSQAWEEWWQGEPVASPGDLTQLCETANLEWLEGEYGAYEPGERRGWRLTRRGAEVEQAEYFEHDWGHRLIAAERHLGSEELATQSYAYDAWGRLASQADEWGTLSVYEYDALGRLVLSAGSSSKGTSLADLVTAYVYDRDGLLIELEDPEGRTSQWQYDGAGRVLGWLRPNALGAGLLRTMSYDGLGRLSELSEQGEHESRVYAWGSTLLSSVSYSTGGGLSYAYDDFNRVEEAWRGDSFGTVYTTRSYDGRGALLSESTQWGQHAHEALLSYDAQGRWTGVLASGGGADALSLSLSWSGLRVETLSAARSSGLPAVTTELSWDGPLLVQSEQWLGDASWLQTESGHDLAGRAVQRRWWAQAAELGAERVWYGLDDRRVGVERTLQDVSTLQLTSYDGAGRLSWSHAWTGADAVARQGFVAWMEGSGDALPSGGVESAWSRSPNGTLLEQSSGNTALWSATRYPSGPGLSSVQTPQDGFASLSWDSRDRLERLPVSGMTLSW
ncbi:MAG: DUF6531 domain-containing protein, partial [Myxococcota bacterium]|nr:DUF6531 domain-containing protein [Myxococcota bacterium]